MNFLRRKRNWRARFETVRKNTIQVAEDIPESKYGFVAAPDVRFRGAHVDARRDRHADFVGH